MNTCTHTVNILSVDYRQSTEDFHSGKINFGQIEEDTTQPNKVIIQVNLNVNSHNGIQTSNWTSSGITSNTIFTNISLPLSNSGVDTTSAEYVSYYNADETKINQWLATEIQTIKTNHENILGITTTPL